MRHLWLEWGTVWCVVFGLVCINNDGAWHWLIAREDVEMVYNGFLQQCSPSNFFKSVCAKISCVQHFTSTHLYYRKTCIKHVQKTFFKGAFVRSKFSCVHSSHDLCTRAQLRGKIVLQWINEDHWLEAIRTDRNSFAIANCEFDLKLCLSFKHIHMAKWVHSILSSMGHDMPIVKIIYTEDLYLPA